VIRQLAGYMGNSGFIPGRGRTVFVLQRIQIGSQAHLFSCLIYTMTFSLGSKEAGV